MKLIALWTAYCATVLGVAVAMHYGAFQQPWAKEVLRDARAAQHVAGRVWTEARR